MSLRAEVLARLVDRLKAPGATSAEGDVFEHRSYAISKGTKRALVVRLDGSEDFDEEADGFDSEARFLPAAVLAMHREADKLLTLAEEVDSVLFALHREHLIRAIPGPSFSAPEQGEEPIFEATWQVQIPFRMSVNDPSVEV